MGDIVIKGPVDGRYQLGYQIGSKFIPISYFVSKDLAQAAADKMLRDRERKDEGKK